MIIELKKNERSRCYKCHLLLSEGDICFLVNQNGKTKRSCMWCQEDYKERIIEWERQQQLVGDVMTALVGIGAKAVFVRGDEVSPSLCLESASG